MMKNPRNLLIFSFLGGIIGVGLGFVAGRMTASNPSKLQRVVASAEMKRVLTLQQEAWNDGDIESFMQGYLKSDELHFASGGDITLGWNETLSRYQKRYSDRAKMGMLKFDVQSVKVIDKDDGLIFGKWTLIRDADMPNGLFTLHLKKGDDGWKVVSDHTSSASN